MSDYTPKSESDITKRPIWSDEEDRILDDSIKDFGTDWKRIREYLPTKTALQCLQRYQTAMKDGVLKGLWSTLVFILYYFIILIIYY